MTGSATANVPEPVSARASYILSVADASRDVVRGSARSFRMNWSTVSSHLRQLCERLQQDASPLVVEGLRTAFPGRGTWQQCRARQ